MTEKTLLAVVPHSENLGKHMSISCGMKNTANGVSTAVRNDAAAMRRKGKC